MSHQHSMTGVQKDFIKQAPALKKGHGHKVAPMIGDPLGAMAAVTGSRIVFGELKEAGWDEDKIHTWLPAIGAEMLSVGPEGAGNVSDSIVAAENTNSKPRWPLS